MSTHSSQIQPRIDRAVIAKLFDVNEDRVVHFTNDGKIMLENVEKTAVWLLKDGDLERSCWICAEIEDDKGRYFETVLLERSPNYDDTGIGVIAVGIYCRNTDIESKHSQMQARFDGDIVLTTDKDHAAHLIAAEARFNEITVTELMREISGTLDTLVRHVRSLDPGSMPADCLKEQETVFLERLKNINRTMATTRAQRATGT